MSLINRKKPIKISIAAEMLGVSVSAIQQGKAGTQDLTLFKYPSSNRLYTYEDEVKKLADNAIIVRQKDKRI